jgi:hypothetical protein
VLKNDMATEGIIVLEALAITGIPWFLNQFSPS